MACPKAASVGIPYFLERGRLQVWSGTAPGRIPSRQGEKSPGGLFRRHVLNLFIDATSFGLRKSPGDSAIDIICLGGRLSPLGCFLATSPERLFFFFFFLWPRAFGSLPFPGIIDKNHASPHAMARAFSTIRSAGFRPGIVALSAAIAASVPSMSTLVVLSRVGLENPSAGGGPPVKRKGPSRRIGRTLNGGLRCSGREDLRAGEPRVMQFGPRGKVRAQRRLTSVERSRVPRRGLRRGPSSQSGRTEQSIGMAPVGGPR